MCDIDSLNWYNPIKKVETYVFILGDNGSFIRESPTFFRICLTNCGVCAILIGRLSLTEKEIFFDSTKFARKPSQVYTFLSFSKISEQVY